MFANGISQGLLDIVQQAASHPNSPARSIAETIPDTTAADSQSQCQRVEAPGSLELVQGSLPTAHEHDDQQQIVSQIQEQHEAGGPVVQPSTTSEPRQGAWPSIEKRALIVRAQSDKRHQEQALIRQPSAGVAEGGPTEFFDIDEISNSQNIQNNPPGAGSDSAQIVACDVGEAAQPRASSSVRDSQPSLTEHSTGEDQFPFHSQYPIRDTQITELPATPASARASRVTSSQRTSAVPATQLGQALIEPSAQSGPALGPSYDPHQSAPLPTLCQSHNSNLPNDSVGSDEYHKSPNSSKEREQNAQVVHLETDLSTQEDTLDSIRETTEKEHRASSESRHDSSQETPERPFRFLHQNSSPVPYPSSYSLRTQESKLPSRPCTTVPTSSSSPSIMAGESTADIIRRQMEEARAKYRTENPFTPKRRPRSSITPSTAPVEGVTASPAASRILRNEQGTRSPSAVPDRSPAAQIPTSLRTVAYAPKVPEAQSPEDARPEPVEPVVPIEHAVALSVGSDDMEVSDADDEDSESLLNDDLQLADQEFIVPLFIQGRQSDMYSQYIALKKDTLEKFLKEPRNIKPISQIEEILSYLRAIETHIDLVFAEAETGVNDDSMTQAEHAVQFGMENSTKFRFLHQLFHHLRDSDPQKHIVLVTEKDDDALFRILETFCKAKYVNYNMPTRDRKADPRDTVGSLHVTVIPSDASPIIRPADLIICLDGVQDAAQIRKKNWAKSPERDIVPVIHLVIPRTVGHIERYIAPSLDAVDRMHTTLATLAHVRLDIGKAIDEATPRDTKCASLVADWMIDTSEGAELSWPIPSIGSVKNVIDYQTQLSQLSTDLPIPERVKRPLVVSRIFRILKTSQN